VTHSSKEVLSELGTIIKNWGQGYWTTFQYNTLNVIEYMHDMLWNGEKPGEGEINLFPGDESNRGNSVANVDVSPSPSPSSSLSQTLQPLTWTWMEI